MKLTYLSLAYLYCQRTSIALESQVCFIQEDKPERLCKGGRAGGNASIPLTRYHARSLFSSETLPSLHVSTPVFNVLNIDFPISNAA